MVEMFNLRHALTIVGPLVIAAAFLSAGLIVVLRPWLETYALAHPNARSSHSKPTAQGGGIAVVAATFVTAWLVGILLWRLPEADLGQFATLTSATALLAVVGAADDLRGLPVAPRLLLQCLAVGGLVAALPADLHIASWLPLWFERLGLFVAGVWIVNLVNFMDGIDWMTVAEIVPIAAAIALLGAFGVMLPVATLVAAALLGGMLGFAAFNRPVARLFLGDVGSLPIGLLLGWLLLHLAARGHVAAALLLPLYYLADATLTLLRRIAKGERVWEAHRSHFYQRATERGFTVRDVVARVFLVNVALVGLALITIAAASVPATVAAMAIGGILVGSLLWRFAQGKT